MNKSPQMATSTCLLLIVLFIITFSQQLPIADDDAKSYEIQLLNTTQLSWPVTFPLSEFNSQQASISTRLTTATIHDPSNLSLNSIIQRLEDNNNVVTTKTSIDNRTEILNTLRTDVNNDHLNAIISNTTYTNIFPTTPVTNASNERDIHYFEQSLEHLKTEKLWGSIARNTVAIIPPIEVTDKDNFGEHYRIINRTYFAEGIATAESEIEHELETLKFQRSSELRTDDKQKRKRNKESVIQPSIENTTSNRTNAPLHINETDVSTKTGVLSGRWWSLLTAPGTYADDISETTVSQPTTINSSSLKLNIPTTQLSTNIFSSSPIPTTIIQNKSSNTYSAVTRSVQQLMPNPWELHRTVVVIKPNASDMESQTAITTATSSHRYDIPLRYPNITTVITTRDKFNHHIPHTVEFNSESLRNHPEVFFSRPMQLEADDNSAIHTDGRGSLQRAASMINTNQIQSTVKKARLISEHPSLEEVRTNEETNNHSLENYYQNSDDYPIQTSNSFIDDDYHLFASNEYHIPDLNLRVFNRKKNGNSHNENFQDIEENDAYDEDQWRTLTGNITTALRGVVRRKQSNNESSPQYYIFPFYLPKQLGASISNNRKPDVSFEHIIINGKLVERQRYFDSGRRPVRVDLWSQVLHGHDILTRPGAIINGSLRPLQKEVINIGNGRNNVERKRLKLLLRKIHATTQSRRLHSYAQSKFVTSAEYESKNN